MTNALLTDRGTRQEHLSDLADWIQVKINVWTTEFKTHHAADDKIRVKQFEKAAALVKGYVDSFTVAVVTDVDEPKIERERLSNVDTRYEHIVILLEMWRDAVEFIREQYVGKIALPTPVQRKINEFEKTISIVETYQESLAGDNYPSYSGDGKTLTAAAARLLRSVCDETGKIGIAANKKRLIDAANETPEGEEKERGPSLAEDKAEASAQGSENSGRIPDFNRPEDDDIAGEVAS